MSILSSLIAVKRTVEIGDVSLVVKGLPLADLVKLLEIEADTVTSLMAGNFTIGDILRRSPSIASTIIQMGLVFSNKKDKPTDEEVISLSFAIQYELLEAILQLTFPEGGKVERILGKLINLGGSESPASLSEEKTTGN